MKRNEIYHFLTLPYPGSCGKGDLLNFGGNKNNRKQREKLELLVLWFLNELVGWVEKETSWQLKQRLERWLVNLKVKWITQRHGRGQISGEKWIVGSSIKGEIITLFLTGSSERLSSIRTIAMMECSLRSECCNLMLRVFTNTSLAITAEHSCSSTADDNALDCNRKPKELDTLQTPWTFPQHSSDSTSKLKDSRELIGYQKLSSDFSKLKQNPFTFNDAIKPTCCSNPTNIDSFFTFHKQKNFQLKWKKNVNVLKVSVERKKRRNQIKASIENGLEVVLLLI
jgi:hypothetical protein